MILRGLCCVGCAGLCPVGGECESTRRALGVRSLEGKLRALFRGSEYFLRNLVDPASSHMLVSKTKPCMSKCKRLTVKLRMAH